jgi:hypothetical protein
MREACIREFYGKRVVISELENTDHVTRIKYHRPGGREGET